MAEKRFRNGLKEPPSGFAETFKYVDSHISVLGDTMGNITLSVPNDVQEQMRRFSEVRWSEVARKAIIERIETLQMAEKLAQKSKLSEKDIHDFSQKIKKMATRRFVDANSH